MILGPFLANQGQGKKKSVKNQNFWNFFFLKKFENFELLNLEKNWEKYFEEMVR